MLSFEQLCQRIEQSKNKKVMITFHSIGDTDAISSALGISALLGNAHISSPDFLSANARLVLESFGMDQKDITNGFIKDAELIVMVDVNNFEDCGSFETDLRNASCEILVIDHHAPSKVDRDLLIFNDEGYNSTASIVYDIFKNLGVAPDKRMAEALAIGIIADSAEFKNATAHSFVQIGELLSNAGLSYQELTEKFSRVAPPEIRLGTLKDLFNSEIAVINKMLFLKGETQSHAAAAADDAIKIGVDIALVASESEKEISFSARCRPPLDKERQFHLGKIMKSIAKTIDGVGGGHPCAAGAYGTKKEGKAEFVKMFENEVFYK